MDFEWDEAKNTANQKKHGIDFAEVIAVFEGWTLDIVDDRFDYGEARTLSIGVMNSALVASVIHTDRDGRIRIISARLASRSERIRYETALQSAADDRRIVKDDR